ncbi:GroES-like protein [Aspergillus steynii IBT 23096]|uniref:GroES-like protein n=1 Tax=Aspergillus steynii IBT 23096 TaxID=1392250 RepID=A0A2I2G848_9EURO|nr:GroES-like protein [Aspergillus steynii IBT 23096]PLB49056.1 GroES-like protein [Aspergillus steynii IBT 23096]
MKAARFYAARDIRIEEIPPPSPTPEQVLVAVEWCGICGSDLNEYLVGPIAIPGPERGPHPLTNETLPITMGHEISGRIVQAPASSSFRPGQKVVVDPRLYCSSCTPCHKSATNCCRSIGFMGLSGGGGGLASTVAVSTSSVHALPEEVDLAAAALIEPLAVAWHAVRLSGVLSTPILIMGGGPVGVAVAFVLRARGAERTIVSEPSARRRKAFDGIAHTVLDPTTDDVVSRCQELSLDGEGVGIVFDCAGVQSGMETGCQALRFGGKYVNLAMPKGPITIPVGQFLLKELTYKASLAYDERDFQDVVATFVAGQLTGVERMITRKVRLEEIVEKGFEELANPNDHIKVMATPTGEGRGISRD